MDEPLQPIVSMWLSKIEKALEYKQANYQRDADEAMRFLNGPYDFMYERGENVQHRAMRLMGGDEDGVPAPTFRMTLNRVAEMVQLFGPVLYHQNPHRQVNSRRLPDLPINELMGMNDPMTMMDPMAMQMQQMAMQQQQQSKAIDKMRAGVLEAYLNYTPNELDLKTESRTAIEEAIIKGCGFLKTEIDTNHQGQKIVGSFFRSSDVIVFDHDMESMRNALWAAEFCCHPTWVVEKEYNLPPGTIPKGNLESLSHQSGAAQDIASKLKQRRGDSNNLLCYWKIYSRMGIGARLSGLENAAANKLDVFGDNIYLVVAPDIKWPLNLPLSVPMGPEDIQQRLQWPIPFWADRTNPWPFTPIMFHPIPRKIWPMSHLKPAMGELLFLNWAYSYLATTIATTSRQLLLVAQGLTEKVKETIASGKTLSIVEVSHAAGFKRVNDFVHFLTHPPMNAEIWQIVQATETNFERRTGLSELMYGQSSRQMRSASEAELKGEQLRIRPDDMATRVEEAMTTVARKEALAARWFITAQDVAPILGQQGAQLWQQLVETSDINAVMEYDYRIEAGSVRRPDRERDATNMQQAMQTLLQPFFSYAQGSGDVKPFNGLVEGWAKTVDMDAEKLMIQPPPPPPPPMPPESQAMPGNGQAQPM